MSRFLFWVDGGANSKEGIRGWRAGEDSVCWVMLNLGASVALSRQAETWI